MDALLLDKNPATTLPLFSSQDHTAPAYVRNTENWAVTHTERLTCISPWNSNGIFQKTGTLISPRHVVFATHWSPPVASTIRFVAADNTIITRTISATQSIPDTVLLYPDLTIGLLDSDVPSNISFAKVLPDGWESLLTNVTLTRPPAFGTDQEGKLLVREAVEIDNTQPPDAVARFLYPSVTLYQNFFENLVSGDSGNPCFFLINGDLVLLAVWARGLGGSGASIAAFKTEINAIMTNLGGGHQLTEIDLSGFSKP